MARPKQIQIKRKQNAREKNCNDIKDRLRQKLAVKTGEKKICITAIMKNESKNVNRLLDSLLPLPPDMISIVDTGSTDNTAELIVEWGRKHDIPTVVHHEPFVNFAYNRTHSIRAAKETFPEADYFLLTDADFVWKINVGGKFNKVLLTEHKYTIEQFNCKLSYWNTRLLSAKVDFECVGVTHEFWRACKDQSTYNGEIRSGRIRTLVIDDKEDGGCKQDKFERDERLLREGLADDNTPDDLKTRYKFYLAQTLRDTQRYEESIKYYEDRVRDGGWAEEVYYAKYRIGICYEEWAWKIRDCINKDDTEFLNKWNPDNLDKDAINKKFSDLVEIAQKYYQDAYKYRKTRAEALYRSTKLYRVLGKNKEAYDNAIIGRKIKYPESDSLFIERGCYDFLFDYELTIVSYYCDNKDVGQKACEKLLLRDDLPEWLVRHVERTAKFYI